MVEHKRAFQITGIILAVIMIVVGIILTVYSFERVERILLQEYDEHLIDLGRSVDRNLENVIEWCRSEMAYDVTGQEMQRAMEQYLEDGDRDALLPIVDECMMGFESVFDDLCVYRGDEQIFRARGEQSALAYSQSMNGREIDVVQDGEIIYIAFAKEVNGLTYLGLVDLSSFYEAIVVDSLRKDYWIVLYNADTNVVLDNNEDIPRYCQMLPYEMEARNDGYSIICRADRNGEALTETYTYIAGDGNEYRCRMVALVGSQNRNGVFTMGLAADYERINQPITKISGWLLGGVLLISVCVVAAIALTLSLIRQNHEANRKLRETREMLDHQEEQAHAQRLELMGSMTSAMTHEFNNMLTPIMGYSLMILENSKEEDAVSDYAAEIYQSAEKAREMTKRLSSLTRKNTGDSYTEVVPDEVVRKAIQIIHPSLPENIALKEELQCDQPVLGNESQILQVLVNLLLNAIHAVSEKEEGGEIVVNTHTEGDKVIFRVSDNGPGIREELKEKIFEPFFTTKEVGKGTGLGLAISRQVAEAHGGSLVVESEYGKGASFLLRLKAEEKKED